MKYQDALKVALECMGLEIRRLALKANMAMDMPEDQEYEHYRNALARYKMIEDAARTLEEMKMEQGRLF